MGKKKRYLIIILLLLIGFSFIAFAGPDDKEKGENGKDVEDVFTEQEETDKEDNEDSGKNENNGNVQKPVIDNSYPNALKAVELAEESLDTVDVEAARKLVNLVTDKNKKQELAKRLDEVDAAIEAIKLVEELEQKVEAAEKREDIEDSISYRDDNEVESKVEVLTNEEIKEDLQTRLEELNKILNDDTDPVISGINDGEITKEDVSITVNEDVIVTVTLNGTKIDDAATFTEEGEYVYTAVDKAFRESKVTFTIDKTSAEATVAYNKTTATNENIVVTITLNEEVQEVEGWTLSLDKKVLTKEFSANETSTIEIKDLAGNITNVPYSITNIDKVKAEATVTYSTDNLTNGNVVVTITFDEEVQEVEDWTISADNKILTKEFSTNEVNTIEVKDLAGNVTKVSYSVTNIDKEKAEATVTYSTNKLTNRNVVVTITFNEEVKEVAGFELSLDKKVLTKELIENETNTIQVEDLAGNITKVNYSVANIDKTPANIINSITGDKVINGGFYNEIAPIVMDNVGIKSIKINDIPFINGTKIAWNQKYTMVAEDLAGNITTVEFTVDTIKPIILLLDRLEVIQSNLIPIKPVIIEANLDTVTVYKDGQPIAYNHANGDALTEAGSYKIVAVDKAGNEAEATFTIDNGGPKIYNGLIELNALVALPFREVTLRVDDEHFDERGIIVLKQTSIEITNGITLPSFEKIDYTYGDTITEEGNFIVIATDEALNISLARFTIDRTAPTFNVVDGNYYPSVTLEVTDPNLLLTVVMKKNQLGISLPTSYKNGDTITEEGEYTIYATDTVGNTNIDNPITFYVDALSPIIEGVENNGIYPKATPVIKDSNLDKVVVTKDGLNYQSQTTYTEEGIYVITATDKAGRNTSVTFEIDHDVLKVEGVEDNKHYGKVNDINASVTPVIIHRGEVTITLTKDNNEYAYTGVETLTEEGEYVLTVVDEYNNNVTVSFAIDNTHTPENILAENKIVPAGNEFISVSVNVTDNIDALKTIMPKEITHSSNNPVALVDGKLSISEEWIGTYTLVYESYDEANNYATKPITIEVVRSDIKIVFDENNLTTSEYDATNKLSSIKAYLIDKNGNDITNTGDIIFTVKDINGNKVVDANGNPAMINAGKYMVYANATPSNSDYKFVFERTFEYEITKATATIKYEAQESTLLNSYEYDGKVKTYNVIATELGVDRKIGEVSTPSANVNTEGYVLDGTSLYTSNNFILDTTGNTTVTVYITKASLKIDLLNITINENGEYVPRFNNVSGDELKLEESEYTITYSYRKNYISWPSAVDKIDTTKKGFYTITVTLNEENPNYYIILGLTEYQVK